MANDELLKPNLSLYLPYTCCAMLRVGYAASPDADQTDIFGGFLQYSWYKYRDFQHNTTEHFVDVCPFPLGYI
jgi:hypothetical protein